MNRPVTASKSSTRVQALDRGRGSLKDQAWSAAFDQLSAADRQAPLEPADLEELSKAAHLIGRQSVSVELLARAHQGFLGRGDGIEVARTHRTWMSGKESGHIPWPIESFVGLLPGAPDTVHRPPRADRKHTDRPEVTAQTDRERGSAGEGQAQRSGQRRDRARAQGRWSAKWTAPSGG